jgi:flagellar motor protein MotB
MENLYKIPETPTANSLTLFVPLYLVVLAFFILLNSISEKNPQKTQKAVSSIEKSFSSKRGKADKGNKEQFLDFSVVLTTHFSGVEALLKSSFQPENIKIERIGNKMQVKIALNEVFAQNSADIISLKQDIIDKLIKTLALQMDGITVKTSVKIDSNISQSTNKESFRLDKERLANIVKKFISIGVASENLTSGITLNTENNLTIETNIQNGSTPVEGGYNE